MHMIELTLVVFVSWAVFLCRASRGFSLTSVVPFIAHRGRFILVYTHLLGSCSDSWFKERGI